jgi:hypothetical protein
MPLADAWGATIDRSVTGSITLTIQVMLPTDSFDDTLIQKTVVVTESFDETKPVTAGAYARYRLAHTIIAQLNRRHTVLFQLWNARCQHARFVWKLLSYQDRIDERIAFRATLPANQRAPVTAEINALNVKRDRFPAYRDRYATDAGEA